MLSFYEMLQLVENDWRQNARGKDREDAAANARSQFAADQMRMDTGDHGVERRNPIIPDRPARVISSADDMENSRDFAHMKHIGRRVGLKRGEIKDIGKQFDGPTIGRGHNIGNPNSGFAPGAAVPERTLQRSQKDVTGAGGRDDVSIANDRQQNAKNRKEQQIRNQMNPTRNDNNYLEKNIEWAETLDGKLKDIVKMKEGGLSTKNSLIDLSKWNTRILAQPEISEKLKKRISDVNKVVYAKIEQAIAREEEINAKDKDSLKNSSMAKYMMRKHSNVF